MRQALDAVRLASAVESMVAQVAGALGHEQGLALVGIRRRGVPLAERIRQGLAGRTGRVCDLGVVDITLYRDDLTLVAHQPVAQGTDISFPVDGRTVVLVDDVLYTGRTIRAAIDQVMDLGRPARIALAVLVDRGHRELPIQADFVGIRLETGLDDDVVVRLSEVDGSDEVVVGRPSRVGP